MANRSLAFCCLVYPDSAPSDWLLRLESLQIQACISPLHDSDLTDDGQLKKPHYHVFMRYGSLKSISQAQSDMDTFGGVYPKDDNLFVLNCFVRSVPVTLRYWCHLDSPDKAQYSVSDVRCFGGLSYMDIINEDVSASSYMFDICDYIRDAHVWRFYDLVLYSRRFKPEWFNVIVRNAYFFKALIQSLKSAPDVPEGFYSTTVDIS